MLIKDTLSPPELARRWGVAPEKVNSLINSGQLRAINLAVNPKGRPRYRIYLSEVERFETERANTKPPAPKARQQRRRRREVSVGGKEYF